MNAKTITTWIAHHRLRTALIALGIVVMAWDWFAIPRLLIMMILPFVFLAIPLVFLASPIILLVFFLRRRARRQQAERAAHGFDPATVIQGQATYPEATPQEAPQRRLTQQELMDMYERYPERFEGVDLGDELDR